MKKIFLVIAGACLGISSVKAQEIGANFNHDPDIMEFSYIEKTGVEWVRTTPRIFDYINGKLDVDDDIGLSNVIEAGKKGYKIAFGFRWDFKMHQKRIPVPGSAEEKKYFSVARRIIERVGPHTQVFKLGNEPNLETIPEDLQKGKDGKVPLVVFTERLLEVVESYYRAHPELKRPDIYTGSLPALFEPKQQALPGVRGLIQMAQENPAIKGLSVHLHIADSLQMKAALDFVRSIMPEKPIIVPEFSLHRLYIRHLSELVGATEGGKNFCKKYGRDPQMPVYKWYEHVNNHKVSSEEWKAFFDSRDWFPPRFFQTFYRHFERYGVVLATYGFFIQSAPKKMGPDSTAWFVNPIFCQKTLFSNPDGSYAANPLWYPDFIKAIEQGKKHRMAFKEN